MSAGNEYSIGMILAVVAMMGTALLIGVSVFLAGQGGSLKLRDVCAKFASIIWVVPALVAVAIPLWRSSLQVTQSSPPHLSQLAVATPVVHDLDAGSELTFESHENSATETKLPEWVTQGVRHEGQTQWVVVKSGFNAALNDAEQQEAIDRSDDQILPQAFDQVRNYINEAYPIPANWNLQESLVRNSYSKTFREINNQEFGKVYRTYVQLKLSPALREQFYPIWKEKNAESRLFAMGAVLTLITLLLGTTATYLRLDRMTAGAYRGRLKFATLSFIAAGALVAGLLIG